MPDAAPARTLLAAHFRETQEDCRAPQLSWGALIGGETITGGDAGLAFRIASVTKTFTAAAVLLLRDRGRLALDQPIAELVPAAAALRPPTADSPRISVRHLLTMGAGFASDNPWGDRRLETDAGFVPALLDAGITFATAPDAGFVYSNTGYALLGAAIHRAAGKSAQRFISDEFLDPLGMMRTTWEMPASDVAEPHRLLDGGVTAEARPLGDGSYAPMGGLWSTADDMLRWARFMLDAHPPRDDPETGPLSRASRREMHAMTRPHPPRSLPLSTGSRLASAGYGMGVGHLEDVELGVWLHHSGGLPGYGSHILWMPHRGVAVVSLANITYAPMAEAGWLALEALRTAGLLPPVRAPDDAQLRKLATTLVGLLTDWDDERAAAVFADNVALDDSLERRRDAARALLGGVGQLNIRTFTANNAADATVILGNTDGRDVAALRFSLSPQVPPRVQEYELSRLPAED